MAASVRASSRSEFVVSSAASNSERPVSLTERMVRVKKPVALQPEEQSFIEKTLHYISGIRGAVKTNLVLSTNTRFPTRYIILIRGLPSMSLDDFNEIRNMNANIRSMLVNMSEETLRIDVWRVGKVPESNSRRKRKRCHDQVTARYDLTSVDKRDRKCLHGLLYRLNALDDIECQFDMHVDTSQPEFYQLDLVIHDALRVASLENVLHECRSFCNEFIFDFPQKIIRAKCLRLAAPLKRRRLLLRNT